MVWQWKKGTRGLTQDRSDLELSFTLCPQPPPLNMWNQLLFFSPLVRRPSLPPPLPSRMLYWLWPPDLPCTVSLPPSIPCPTLLGTLTISCLGTLVSRKCSPCLCYWRILLKHTLAHIILHLILNSGFPVPTGLGPSPSAGPSPTCPAPHPPYLSQAVMCSQSPRMSLLSVVVMAHLSWVCASSRAGLVSPLDVPAPSWPTEGRPAIHTWWRTSFGCGLLCNTLWPQ